MEVNENFAVPQEQINFKPAYENINGHFNGSKYLQLYLDSINNYRIFYNIYIYIML